MRENKRNYEIPLASPVDVILEGIVCVSRHMKFGSGNSSGKIDEQDVVDGGSF